MSALCLELVVRVCRIALPGPKHPPEWEKWKERHLVQNALRVPDRPPAPTSGVGTCVSGGCLRLVKVTALERKM